MRIGMFIAEAGPRGGSTPDAVVAAAQRAEALGLDAGWVPHVPWTPDGLTALALAGRETSRIELGTAVVPTWTQHPYAMAQHALTVQAACGGRLLLGIGPSHPSVAENWYGASYKGVIHHVREYVGVLEAAFEGQAVANREDHGPGGMGGPVAFQGEHYRVQAMLDVPGATPVPILLAALAPLMLRLAGSRAAGTITWMGDERAHREHIVPRIQAAAREARRPAPRVVAGLPLAVCDDLAAGRARAERVFGLYSDVPTYARILARGDARSPADVILVGPERLLRDRLAAYGEAGVTDLAAMVFPVGASAAERAASRARSEDFLASLAAGA